jgi:hypothetical protein
MGNGKWGRMIKMLKGKKDQSELPTFMKDLQSLQKKHCKDMRTKNYLILLLSGIILMFIAFHPEDFPSEIIQVVALAIFGTVALVSNIAAIGWGWIYAHLNSEINNEGTKGNEEV